MRYGIKVLFLIYDKIPLTDWKVVKATDFIEWLQIITEDGDGLLNIINIYNPLGRLDEPRLSK